MNPVGLVLILFFVLLLAVSLVFYLIWLGRPKWQKVYDFLWNQMYQFLLDNDISEHEMRDVKEVLVNEFKLSEEEASLCITNWRDEKWFQNCEFLKDD